ncbi:dynein axonemal heavy chain 17-like [Dicentrarchus labrax]|uniref:dynein axonemal heavy chain 17-like n=1 Tax=Dicentrarchus labrax TaxID=13489 RepID=UPI0021F689CD|nr:dynein axonemal heavy chain 17-like [Dicentrarchus labrax]
MENKEERLDPVRTFTIISLRLDPETWREFVSERDNQLIFNRFLSAQDNCNLFIWKQQQQTQSVLSVSLHFPENVHTKVICVSKKNHEVITKENATSILMIQEVPGGDTFSYSVTVIEEVICPLLGNLEMNSSYEAGVAEEALRTMKRLKNAALVMKAQIEGLTHLSLPDALRGDAVHDEGRKLSDVHKLLHACDSSIIEWAELVSEFLQRDSSQPILDGRKPLPTEEFNFWKNRLKNLNFIQQQLMSSRAKQLGSIVQTAESVYWATLTDIYRDVQEALKEAEDVTLSLNSLQKQLEEVEQMEYKQLEANMAAVMEEVRLVWIRSESYCRPSRMVVLLQEICNLFIQMSRKFLCGEEVMRGLVSNPALVHRDVSLVIRTLLSFREAYLQCKTQLENQSQQDGVTQTWDVPLHLVFKHLDNFLTQLHSIREAFCVVLQYNQVDQTVLSGVNGRMWTDAVQGVYEDFLSHVTVLSECKCDPTDPDDQSSRLHLDQFQDQMLDLDRQLGSVLSRAFENCCDFLSASKLVEMFEFVLDRPLIQDQLHPQLIRLVELVLMELDQIEVLFYCQRDKPETFSRFTPTAAAGLCWTQQLKRRTENTLENYRKVEYLCMGSAKSQLVQQRAQQILDLLQDFRDQLRTDCSCQLDSDCAFILQQPLIQQKQQGMLGVNCSHKLEAVLRELRYVSRERDVELLPHAARLFTVREDVTQSRLSLGHMVSCYNQVISDALQVELPLIQDQQQELYRALSELQRNTWSCEGVQHLVEQRRESVLIFHSTVSKARNNMDAMTNIIQGWAELHLLQRSGDLLLEGGATGESYRQIREEGQELLKLTQVNRSLYGAEDSFESWIRYLDHIDDKVQDALFQLLLRSLHSLSDYMSPQVHTPRNLKSFLYCAPLQGGGLELSLQLEETGSVFEPSVGDGLSDLLKNIISDIYTAASLPPRISVSHQGNYQVSLQQCPELSALEQEVMHRLLQVREEAERLRVGLDRYSYLWQSDRLVVLQEFLTYSRRLGPEELDAAEAPPTLKDFWREIESLHSLSREVADLDDIIVLHSWLQVDLRPFRDSLLSIIYDWTHMYTNYLLDSVSNSLQQVTQCAGGDEESSCSSSFPLTETIILLEAAGVQLPEHLSAQLQC